MLLATTDRVGIAIKETATGVGLGGVGVGMEIRRGMSLLHEAFKEMALGCPV
jgi:hypothetical protein